MGKELKSGKMIWRVWKSSIEGRLGAWSSRGEAELLA